MTDTPNSDKSIQNPLWIPSETLRKNSHIHTFATQNGQNPDDYHSLWRWSIDHMEDFWSALWDYTGVVGDKGSVILKDKEKMRPFISGGAHFFPEAKINWAENMLKRRDEMPAIIFRNEKGEDRQLSFREVADKVSQLQQFLKAQGVTKGDRVAGYLPNLPETLIAALAVSSIGAIWSSASPDFGAQGIVDRFGQIEPKILFTADGYYYNGKTLDCLSKVKDVLPKIPSIEKVVVISFVNEKPDLTGLDKTILWDDALKEYDAKQSEFTRVEFNHPLFIMFSSGTTGIPKCIVHGHGGTLLTHLKEHQMQCDVKENDRVFHFTTCGWMMWNWQVSAMASGATLLLYDGSPFYPKAQSLWDYTSQYKATLFGTGAKYIDALKAHDQRPGDTHDLSHLKTITSTGSPLVHESFDYVYDAIKKDVHLASVSGGTDVISCFVIGNPISPVWRGEIQGSGLGYAMNAYDETGKPIPPGAGSGEMVCEKPFPSMPVMFWNDESGERYRAAYFERFDNVWCHGDWIERTKHNGFIIHGRSDATLNPGGVRIGTAEIYRQVEQIEEVEESIAVGQTVNDDERIILFVRLRKGQQLNDDIIARIKKQIKDGASPRHVPAKVIQVTDIPRTKSGKIVELAVREVIHGRPVKNIESLANPEALNLYSGLTQLGS